MLSKLISYVPNEVWPAFPDSNGSQILALLYQFEQSQYLPPARLLERQFLQINEIFKHSFKTVPFYKNKFKAMGLRRKTKITPDMWPQIPILSRSMLQQFQEDLLSRKIPQSHGYVEEVETSGSTGSPIQVSITEVILCFNRALALRDHFWHQRDVSGKRIDIFSTPEGESEYPSGTSLPNWGPTTAGIIPSGLGKLLNSSTGISLQAKFLLQEEPDYLFSYPSNLEALASYFIQEGLQLNKLREVRTMGETVRGEVRSACNKAWGVPLVDVYSAKEVGSIALQCPENKNIYHVQSENLYVEVVDNEGQPCNPGEIGRVLLTTLHNSAMPLIRYEIGDYAEVGELCSCGRTLPVLTQVMGRQRNMLALPSGDKIWPRLMSIYGEKSLQIKQFQLVQKSLDRLEARLVTPRQLTNEEESRFKNSLLVELKNPFNIDIIYFENIPRSKGGKFEDFISEVA